MRTKHDCLMVLHQLGISEGDTVLIHDSNLLKQCINQSATFIEALNETLGEDGTICTYEIMDVNQDPSHNPKIEFSDRDKVRQELVEFDWKKYREIYYNPTFVALTKQSGRLFNTHPRVVVTAVGKYSKLLTKGQPIDFPYGLQSAFESLRQLNAKVLYFDEDYSKAHELRLAYRPNLMAIQTHGCVLGNSWMKYNDYKFDESRYEVSIKQSIYRELEVDNKKIQSVNYQSALNHFIENHEPLFTKLGQ
ncbi:MAG TPA: AAC(3) family N-acetyltransferase [Erysipelothrix sp.]|nr:AAC(3) family N-acetyltransferase [Erysipelothrix sp.]